MFAVARRLPKSLDAQVGGWKRLAITRADSVDFSPVSDAPPSSSKHGSIRIIPAPSTKDLNHDQLRQCTLVDRRFYSPPPPPSSTTTFLPSPASQMCQTFGFSLSFFFKEKYLQPDILMQSLSALAHEVPQLSGRVALNTMLPAGLRSMRSAYVDMQPKAHHGVEFVLAETKTHRIQDLGPATWLTGMSDQPLSQFTVPFYTEPFDANKMYKGEESLFKLKLTRCVDGQIVSVTVSHLLVDAGRALRLLERLAEYYRHFAYKKPLNGSVLKFDPSFETTQGLQQAVEGANRAYPAHHPDYRLSIGEMMKAPRKLYEYSTTKNDVCMVYLPKSAVKRLKAVACGGQTTNREGASSSPVSTMDAVQGFIATLIADLRKKPLVPTAPEEVTVNVDLLHRDVPFNDLHALSRHLGNAVHILHVPGLDPKRATPSPINLGTDSASEISKKLSTAIGMNARLIRQAIASFRSDFTNTLQALDHQHIMVSLPEAQIGSAFVVKGAQNKLSSTTTVTAFTLDRVTFGCGPPLYVQINHQPRFDWWTIIQSPQGYGDGILCTMTIESGLQDALVNHPVWSHVVHEAHVFLPSS